MASVPVSGLVTFMGKGLDEKYHYLRHMREQGPFNHTLTFSGPDALTPYVRFYVELSANHEGLGHIRSCYNNKYWVPTKINDSWYISVTAKEPEEDDGKDSCTLFEFRHVPGGDEVRQSIIACSSIVKQQPASSGVGETKGGYLHVTTNGFLSAAKTLDIVVASKEEKLLPKYVRFKGDNGKYLGCLDGNFLKFECTDPCDARVIHTIHHDPDGKSIGIKSEKANRFWRVEQGDWIVPSILDNDKDKQPAVHFFEWITYGNNMIALKYGTKFLKRLTWDGHEDGLNACADTIESYAKLQLEEAVLTRSIYNVQYHMDETRIYDNKQGLVMATAHSTNYSSTETTAKLNLKFGLATTSSWSKSTTSSWGVNASVHFGVPKLVEAIDLSFSLDIGGHYDRAEVNEDGGSVVHSEEQSVDYEMKVPPRTKMTVQAIAKKASYDIPYSCYQRDVLTNGVIVTKKIEDGLFRGVSGYDFNYRVTEKELTADDLAKEQAALESQRKWKL